MLFDFPIREVPWHFLMVIFLELFSWNRNPFDIIISRIMVFHQLVLIFFRRLDRLISFHNTHWNPLFDVRIKADHSRLLCAHSDGALFFKRLIIDTRIFHVASNQLINITSGVHFLLM